MFALGRNLAHFLLDPISRLRDSLLPANISDASPGRGRDGRDDHIPTPTDIIQLRVALARKTRLPVDIIDEIFDHAEYWASSSVEVDYLLEQGECLRVRGRIGPENVFMLRSIPLGLTGLPDATRCSPSFTKQPPPIAPLEEEHDVGFFSDVAGYPTPRLSRPARKVVFTIRSKDQGFSSTGTQPGSFDGSWTWFEAGLERFDASQNCDPRCDYDSRGESPDTKAPELPVCSLRPIEPTIEPSGSTIRYVERLASSDLLTIQRNRVAWKQVEDYSITWRWDDIADPDWVEASTLDQVGRGKLSGNGEFVRNLKMGDMVTVWGMARFPQWVNHVEHVGVEVYWAV